jgi:hypothetical protein
MLYALYLNIYYVPTLMVCWCSCWFNGSEYGLLSTCSDAHGVMWLLRGHLEAMLPWDQRRGNPAKMGQREATPGVHAPWARPRPPWRPLGPARSHWLQSMQWLAVWGALLEYSPGMLPSNPYIRRGRLPSHNTHHTTLHSLAQGAPHSLHVSSHLA